MSLSSKIGVMQGRLLPKYNGRYQAHPIGNWQKEFHIAREYDLISIEFILDFNEYEKNPLMSETGTKSINTICRDSGVKVSTICADYFMEAPLHSTDNNIRNKSCRILRELLQSSSAIGVTDIVIPCVDQGSLRNSKDKSLLISTISDFFEDLEKTNIRLALETDLNPKLFYELLSEFDSQRITVNYDIGNSASLGYNIDEEFDTYGDKITDIHIKDRKINGKSVILGQGNADLIKLFKRLNEMEYSGHIIMQAFRDDEGLAVFSEQLNYTKDLIRTCDYED